MTTRIKVTLDKDQWEAVFMAVTYADLDSDGFLGKQRVEEIVEQINLAAAGTGEGEPCQCEEVDGE